MSPTERQLASRFSFEAFQCTSLLPCLHHIQHQKPAPLPPLPLFTTSFLIPLPNHHIKPFPPFQFQPLLAKANASRDTSAVRHPAISECDDATLELLNLAAKCIDKSPVARPTMAEVFSNLTHIKTAMHGHVVQIHADKVQEGVSKGEVEALASEDK